MAAASARALAVAVAAFIVGCTTIEPEFVGADDPDVARVVDRDPVPTRLPVCHGYGCRTRAIVRLGAADWLEIRALFIPKATDATEERRRIAAAIARIEAAVGPRAGTATDRPRAPLILYDLTQLDCVDESINTSTYLHLLDRAELLVWHRPAMPARRGTLWRLNYHFTAVMTELRSGAEWAVDSWFFANGEPPAVVPLDLWRAGWDPDESGDADASS